MQTQPDTPIDRPLTAMLLSAPLGYLVVDTLYAVRGWEDPTAGVLHVLAATAYGFVVLRVTTWVHARPGWAAAVLVTGLVGMAGNVAYGFNTIHVSLGDTDLVDASGAAVLIKPLGLFFPLSLLLMAAALRRAGVGRAWVGPVLAVAALGWPVAHITNVGWLAVLVNVVLVAGLGSLVAGQRARITEVPVSAW